jgi:DUF1680 family protein
VALERAAGTANLIDVLERVLYNGIVVEIWMSVAVVFPQSPLGVRRRDLFGVGVADER